MKRLPVVARRHGSSGGGGGLVHPNVGRRLKMRAGRRGGRRRRRFSALGSSRTIPYKCKEVFRLKLEEMTRYITLQYDDFNDFISLSSKRLRSVIQMGQEETCNWSIINEMTFPYGKCPSETTILSESESTGLPSFDRRSGFLNGNASP